MAAWRTGQQSLAAYSLAAYDRKPEEFVTLLAARQPEYSRLLCAAPSLKPVRGLSQVLTWPRVGDAADGSARQPGRAAAPSTCAAGKPCSAEDGQAAESDGEEASVGPSLLTQPPSRASVSASSSSDKCGKAASRPDPGCAATEPSARLPPASPGTQRSLRQRLDTQRKGAQLQQHLRRQAQVVSASQHWQGDDCDTVGHLRETHIGWHAHMLRLQLHRVKQRSCLGQTSSHTGSAGAGQGRSSITGAAQAVLQQCADMLGRLRSGRASKVPSPTQDTTDAQPPTQHNTPLDQQGAQTASPHAAAHGQDHSLPPMPPTAHQPDAADASHQGTPPCPSNTLQQPAGQDVRRSQPASQQNGDAAAHVTCQTPQPDSQPGSRRQSRTLVLTDAHEGQLEGTVGTPTSRGNRQDTKAGVLSAAPPSIDCLLAAVALDRLTEPCVGLTSPVAPAPRTRPSSRAVATGITTRSLSMSMSRSGGQLERSQQQPVMPLGLQGAPISPRVTVTDGEFGSGPSGYADRRMSHDTVSITDMSAIPAVADSQDADTTQQGGRHGTASWGPGHAAAHGPTPQAQFSGPTTHSGMDRQSPSAYTATAARVEDAPVLTRPGSLGRALSSEERKQLRKQAAESMATAARMAAAAAQDVLHRTAAAGPEVFHRTGPPADSMAVRTPLLVRTPSADTASLARSRSVPTAPPHTPSLSSRTSLTRSHAASLVALPMAWDTRHVLKNEDSSAVWRPLVKPGDPSGGTLWKPITRAPSKHLLATHAPRGGHASATAMLASTAPAQGVYAQRGVDGGRRVSEFSGGRVDDRMVDTEPVERHTANGRFAGLSQAIARGMMASGGVTQTSSVRGF